MIYAMPVPILDRMKARALPRRFPLSHGISHASEPPPGPDRRADRRGAGHPLFPGLARRRPAVRRVRTGRPYRRHRAVRHHAAILAVRQPRRARQLPVRGEEGSAVARRLAFAARRRERRRRIVDRHAAQPVSSDR
ncbi:hypothetical protein F01_410287 [Burkholderia cenocepacia]|nr:hypothetical protein F01_410287 [Burkholderia cenocepacia]